jgi:coenzyme F420 hydrogenase subunit beta
VKSIKSLQRVIDHNLCNRCGTCVGLSGGKIHFSDKTGSYRPVLDKSLQEDIASEIYGYCSGKGFDFPAFRKTIYGPDARNHVFIGPYKKIYIGYANDEKVRKNAASGGILSAILLWLLEQGRIEGVVTLGMSDEEPWLTKPLIATTPEEILMAAQSKYIISSTNELLPEIGEFKGRLAYVGLPGQVQSIRLLQSKGHPLVKNIKYIFGPFYGNTLHFSSVKSFLRSQKVKDHTLISRLYFRYGEWPGNMRTELKDGRIFELPKFHANYLIPFHILKNSLLCTDLTNEFTDISGGDAWAPEYEERGKGFSMVIERSDAGSEILREMKENGYIDLIPVSEEEAIKMHSHGYDLKKRGTFIRMKYRKWLGLPNPDYGYALNGFSFSRYAMEVVIDGLFMILGTKIARLIVERINPSFIGRFFEKIRTLWKKSTHKIKRDQLNQP